MTLVRWNPFREVGDWDRSIDQLFDGIFPHMMEKESRRGERLVTHCRCRRKWRFTGLQRGTARFRQRRGGYLV